MGKKTKERDFDQFDQFAANYRELHNENIKLSGADSAYFSEYKIKEVLREEGGPKPLHLLDLGCGDGTTTAFFAQYFPQAQLLGIDITRELVAQAQALPLPQARFETYDGITIPAPAGSMDVVFIACVLHHIAFAHHPALMQEVKRVLKPGGRLYIFEHNPYNPVTRRVVDTCPFDADAVLLPPPYSLRLLRQAGFREVRNRFTIFFPRSPLFRPLLGLEPWLNRVPLGGQYYTRALR